jgi:single-strand DNA-binding protein
MADFNQVTIIGRLTREPETRFTSSGTQICSFGIATSRRYKQGEEEKQDVLFIDVSSFGRLAEICGQYLYKGQLIFLLGRLRLEQWQSEDGSKRSKHSIIADTVQFLGRKDDASGAPEPDGGDDIPF